MANTMAATAKRVQGSKAICTSFFVLILMACNTLMTQPNADGVTPTSAPMDTQSFDRYTHNCFVEISAGQRLLDAFEADVTGHLLEGLKSNMLMRFTHGTFDFNISENAKFPKLFFRHVFTESASKGVAIDVGKNARNRVERINGLKRS